jgi:hypothetical protein
MKAFAALFFSVALAFMPFRGFCGGRINQEGRILGPQLPVTAPTLFNTTNADAILATMQIFPVTNPWNEDVSRLPVLTNSSAIIAQIMADLKPSRLTLQLFQEMNFVLAPDNQPLVPIDFVLYPGDSDPGPYPVPANMPIEGWPTQTGALTLQQWQQSTNSPGSDRHSIVVQPGDGNLWETWEALLAGTNWQAANGAKFNLQTNGLRPAGETSGDAAGLPMFPALVRFDECERGMVEHACRLVVVHTRKEYIYPGNHYATYAPYSTNANEPAMGQRLRLKSSFTIPPAWTKEEKAVLLALKKYGCLVADNGNYFSISITPDDRWPSDAFADMTTIGITNFEVVQSTGPAEGPRSPGAPVANAGPNQLAPVGTPIQLQGSVAFTGSPPVIKWTLYSGPASVVFGNAASTNTTVTFGAPGVYTLMLSASDVVHAVAYAAVVITAQGGFNMSISRSGTNASLSWLGGSPPYVLESSPALPASAWSEVATTASQNLSVPMTNRAAFFRVRGM